MNLTDRDNKQSKMKGDGQYTMNIGKHIASILESQGRSKIWTSEQIGINYKTFVNRLKNDRLTAYDLLVIGRVLNVDLDEMKTKLGGNENGNYINKCERAKSSNK